MSQIHLCFRRINVLVNFDLVGFCTLVDGQLVPLTLDQEKDVISQIERDPSCRVIHRSDLSSSAYILHQDVLPFLQSLECVSFDWFEGMIVAVVELNINVDHVASQEEK